MSSHVNKNNNNKKTKKQKNKKQTKTKIIKKQQKGKTPKFEISPIFIQLCIVYKYASMHIFGVNLLRTVRGDVVWSFFSHMAPC